jgi:ubiquinone/menaquinone biosynthesis C-methylase UbiE
MAEKISSLEQKLEPFYTVNDGKFWDRYVLEWESDPESKALQYLGNEWHGEEIFLDLLEKYASPEHLALEIGCGGGRITSKAVSWFRHLLVTDVSKQMLRKCRESVPEDNLSFHQIDGFTLDAFDDNSIDCVFSHDVFVHFSSLQVYPYLMEIKRILKPKGIAILSFYNFRVHYDYFRGSSVRYARERRIPPHMRVHYLTEEMVHIMLEDLSLKLLALDTQNFLIPIIGK